MKIKTIYRNFCCNYFSIIPVPIGYRYYPITYNNQKYVIELVVQAKKALPKELDDVTLRGNFFYYSNKRRFLFGHKGTYIGSLDDCQFIEVDNQTFDLRTLQEEDFKIHMPEIFKYLLEEFEKQQQQKKERNVKLEKIKQWDGVIK